MSTDLRKLYEEIKKTDYNEELSLNSRVLIIDGMNTYIRSFSAVPSMNDDGAHVGGMVGFLKSIGLAIRTLRPTRCVIVFDGKGGSQHRRKIYSEYKENRKSMTRLNRTYDFQTKDDEIESVKVQLLGLIEILQKLPVTTIAIDNVEADDVIAYIAHLIEERNGKSIILSTDKDFLQIVNTNITVWHPMKKKMYDVDAIVSEYNIHPNNFIIYRILDGDTSDNIPGVKGVGKKTLQKYYPQLKEEKKLELIDILEFALKNQEEAKIHEKISANEELLERNLELMRLDRSVISGTSKMKIVHQLDDNFPQLMKFELTKLFQQHKLWSSFSHYDEWLFTTFMPLTRFSMGDS